MGAALGKKPKTKTCKFCKRSGYLIKNKKTDNSTRIPFVYCTTCSCTLCKNCAIISTENPKRWKAYCGNCFGTRYKPEPLTVLPPNFVYHTTKLPRRNPPKEKETRSRTRSNSADYISLGEKGKVDIVLENLPKSKGVYGHRGSLDSLMANCTSNSQKGNSLIDLGSPRLHRAVTTGNTNNTNNTNNMNEAIFKGLEDPDINRLELEARISLISLEEEHKSINNKYLNNKHDLQKSKIMSIGEALEVSESENHLENIPSKSEANKLLRQMITIKEANPFMFYTFIKKVGEGSFGQIFVAREKATSRVFAIKQGRINKKKMDYRTILEIGYLHSSSHRNILSYQETYRYSESLWLVLEYMNGGCLTFLIKDNLLSMTEDLIAYILSQVLYGLEYLHSQGRVHRDIKSDNILLSSDGQIKLADFGYAAQLTQEKGFRLTQCGTMAWMAPEVLLGDKYDVGVDVWSTGILALEMVYGDPPYFTNCNPQTMYNLITESPAPRLEGSKWSSSFKEFISLCLQKDINQRPTVSQLLAHKFIEGRDFKKIVSLFVKLISRWFIQLEKESSE